LIDTDWLSLLLVSSFTAGMNDLLRPPIFPGTDSKKSVSESILLINALFPDEKVTFFGIKSDKHYLLMLLPAKSG
jgi:hypothetical protein